MNKVSIIISTYNRAGLLPRAIKSVIGQTFPDFELIVVDDGSTEDAKGVVEEFRKKYQKIKYIRHKTNRGSAAARNTGIREASGKYIAFLDSDDEWLPEKLEKQVELLERLNGNEWGCVYCGYFYINKKGIKKPVSYNKSGNLKLELLRMEAPFGPSSTLLFSKEAVDTTGFFDESNSRHDDWNYLVRFFRKYKIHYCEGLLAKKYGDNLPEAAVEVICRQKYLLKLEKDIAEYGEKESGIIYAKHWLAVAKFFAREMNIRESIFYLKKSIGSSLLPCRDYLSLFFKWFGEGAFIYFFGFFLKDKKKT